MITAVAGAARLPRSLAIAASMAWRGCRLAFAAQIVLAMVTGLAPVATAWLLRAILDDLARHSRSGLLPLVLLLGLGGATAGLLPSVSQYLAAQSERTLTRYATAELFAAVTRLAGLRRLEDPAFQDRLRLAEQAGSSGPGQIMTSGITMVQAALTLTGFLLTLVVLSPVMAIVVVGATIPAVYLERGIARRQVELMAVISQGQRRQFFYGSLLVSLAAAKEIRLFGLGSFFRSRMLAELLDIQRASREVDRRVLAVNTSLAGISAAVTAGGLLWAVLAAASGRLTIGDVSVFVVALAAVAATLSMLITGATVTYEALLLFGSYQAVLDEPPDLPVRAGAQPTRPLRHGIEVDDVWFRYGQDQPWILQGITCVIPHGEAVALVGANGAGKSTLVKLLCRFYDPDHGRILWDGVDLRDLDLATLRERISAVFQDYMAYELSAADNIAAGDLAMAGDEDAVHAAALRAGVHHTLSALPRGYRTMLSRAYFDMTDEGDPQAGVQLSGGQWQRVALARAFLRGSRDLMILDEPSSGLDAEAEHDIHAGLTHQRRGRSTVLIAHRLNTVRYAQQILVLADGVISERGNHDSLMAQRGLYARLFCLQADGYAAESAIAGSSRD